MTHSQAIAPQLGANLQYTKLLSDEAQVEQFQWTARKMSLIVETLRQLPALERVADFGCRAGNEAAYYRDQTGIQEMHGFEIGEEPLENARKLGLKTHVWISGVSPCPVEDNFFDAVIAGDLIEHLMDTDVFLQELRRIVKPGGHLIITIPNLVWWWSRIRILQGKVPGGAGAVSFNHCKDSAVDTKHLRLSVNSEWLHLFAQYHLECVQVNGYNYPQLLRFPLNQIDNWMAQFPTLAHSSLYLLRKPVN